MTLVLHVVQLLSKLLTGIVISKCLSAGRIFHRHIFMLLMDFDRLVFSHHFFSAFITGSIARSASLPVFNLLRGRFWGFSPRRGDTLHRWGWNLARRRGPSSVPNFTPLVQRQGPPKLKFLLRFDQNVEHKRPAGAYPFSDFHQIRRFCTSFQDALAFKIWLDLLEGLWSYGGFKLMGSGYPKFSAPPIAAKLCVRTTLPPKKFQRRKNVLEVLYHHAKFGWARISPATAAAKDVEFLSVCLSVHHAWKSEFVRPISPWRRWSTETIWILLDRGRFVVVHPCSTFWQWCQLATSLNAQVQTTTILRPFFRDHPGEPVPEENFWTLWCKGRLTETDTLTIRLGATPSGLTSAHHILYGSDALPAAQPTASKHWRQSPSPKKGKNWLFRRHRTTK